MSYIGNTTVNQNYVPAVDYFNGDGSTTAFTLSRPVYSTPMVQVTVANVPQNPGSAFTVSGSTITFTSAPPSGTANIYVYYTSPNTQVVQPGQGTVGTIQLADASVTSAKLASNLTLGGTTTASTGVTFSANPGGRTQGTLNDYEVGTYSASFGYSSTLTSTSPTSTGTVNGTYVKVGRLVTVAFDQINQSAMGNIVLFTVTLPFAATAGQGYFSGYGVTGRYGGSTHTQWYPQVLTSGSSTTANLYVEIPGGGSAFPSLESGGTNIVISITYIATA